MFGIESTEQLGQIVEGWTNYALNREEELSESRMKICRECPIYNAETDRCDGKKGINTKTGEVVNMPGKDVIMGCNCFCKKKSRVLSAKCVLGKWDK